MLGDPISVFAKSSTKLVDIEVENSGVAVLKFQDDVLGVIEVTTATRPMDLEGSHQYFRRKRKCGDWWFCRQ